jgi:tetratricopeptide (TPR) repeat protein
MRAERDAERQRLAPRVEELVGKLGTSRTPSDTKKIFGELDALGSEAAPLLITYVDPGANPKPDKERQASEVTAWLIHARNPGVFDELVRLAQSASPAGRVNALRALAHEPDSARALAALRALYPTVSGSLRAECVRALAEHDRGDPLLIAALSDTHSEVLAAAVRALRDEPRKKPRPEVLALLGDANRGADVLNELVDYCCFPGQELEEETVLSLVRFACRADLAVDARLKVMEGLPSFGLNLTNRLRKELEPLLSSSDSALRESALVALVLLKDGKAKRDLMKFYDDQVDQNPAWPLAYQRRGDVELKIGEYKDAVRDYLDAIRLHKDSAKLPGNRDLWVNLARAYVKDNKLKPAADALEEFGMSSDLRRALKLDPDFQPLVEHTKYKSLFE